MIVQQSIERNLVNYLSSSFTSSITIYTGMDWRASNEEGSLENTIIVYAGDASPLVQDADLGTYIIPLKVFLRVPYNGEEGLNTFYSASNDLRLLLCTGSLSSHISGSSIYVYHSKYLGSVPSHVEDCHAEDITFQIVACATK